MYLKNDRYSGIFTVSTQGKFELKQCTGQKTFSNQARENLAPVAKRGKDGLCQICKPPNLRKLLLLQGSKLTLANSQNASDFDNLRVRKTSTSKRLRVGIIHVSQTKGKNLLVVSPVC